MTSRLPVIIPSHRRAHVQRQQGAVQRLWSSLDEDCIVARRNHQSALDTVVRALKQIEGVLAIGAYGSTATRTWTDHSDIDLVAVINRDPPIESLRFFVEGVPVDLNLRSADESPHGIRGASFMPETVAIYDPGDVLRSAATTRKPGGKGEARLLRYLLKHTIDKIRQISGDPQQTRLKAAAEVGYFMRGYFLARGEELGESVSAMARLRKECPELLNLLEQAVLEPTAAASLLEQAGEIALGPVGGLWKTGEIMAVDWPQPDPDAESFCNEYLAPLTNVSDPPRKLM